MAISKLRPSPIAGTWYSKDPEQLAQQVDEFINQARIPKLIGDVVALIAPHAGYRFSGKTAGHSFQAVHNQEFDLVAVVSPFHGSHPKQLLTTAHQAYTTPLGSLPVDSNSMSELQQFLEKESGLELAPIANDSEHAIEIELPFLQRALAGDFKLLPVMISSDQPEMAHLLGRGLAEVLRDRDAFMIASTDLSHFYPQSKAQELDSEMLRQIKELSPEGVLETQQTGKGYACGVMAVAAVLWAAQDLGANGTELLHYSTSGETSGDRHSVVGYGAVALLKGALVAE
ncbi:MAG: AmmeMemoRadiSam system protein B [Chloroflexi bacterium]|nr:AmmeMemoRadiSam system protein B [Chloroflexota bacterium]